jgi:outer membrane protein assembly factor BamB
MSRTQRNARPASCRGAALIAWLLICAAGGLLPRPAAGQERDAAAGESGQPAAEPQPQDVAQRSLPLRTALHHDASLDAPFEQLVGMYRDAGRTAELVDVYRKHVADYPSDANAAAVFVRLLAATGDSQSLATARAMAERHKAHAYLQYLDFQALRRAGENRTLDPLERAIALSSSPRQKAAWTEQLLSEAAKSDQAQLVDKYLGLMAAEAGTAAAKLEVAQRMMHFRRHDAALALLDEAARLNPSPEAGVQIETLAASAEIAGDHGALAAARLDRLLAKLGSDYWNRGEIVRRRLALVNAEKDRTALIEAASQKLAARPKDEAANLELAEVLIGFERRREALAVLLAAGRAIPASQRIEKLTLALIDRLRDERARQAYLAQRVKAFPDRADLLMLEVKSLLLTGDRATAHEQLEQLLRVAPAEERVALQLSLARSLDRANLSADAAEILERVVAALPDRFDVRRELAELYSKLGNRSRARELFAGDLPAEIDADQVLGFVPFLIKQEMFIEAQRALEKAIRPDDANLDLRLLLADVYRRTGNRAAADRVLSESRALADTSARYRQWLEAEATLHQEDETFDALVSAEQQRLSDEAGPWADARTERVLALLEIAARGKSKLDLNDLAGAYLDADAIPLPARRRIRQQLVRTMSSAPEQRGALAEQLQELINAQPEEADEYRTRLALLRLAENDYPSATSLLAEVRVGQLHDVQLLHDLEKGYAQLNLPRDMIRVLERLTVLEPTNKGNWEAWFYALALSGYEDQLRDGLRRLLAGVEGLTLEDSIKRLLQSRLIQSYNRSILANVSDGRPAPLADALAMLTTLENQVSQPQQALWIWWVRAYMLNRLGRVQPRDEAMQEMQRMFAELAKSRKRARLKSEKAEPPTAAPPADARPSDAPPADAPPGDDSLADQPDVELDEADLPWLHAGDGLSISIANVRHLLTSSPAAAWPKADARLGPLPRLKLAWATDFPSDQPIERLLVGSGQRLYLVDARGTLSCVDTLSGKSLWAAESAIPLAGGPRINVHTNNFALNSQATASTRPGVEVPVIGPGDRIYFGHVGEVHCLSGHDGRLLWRSAASVAPASSSAPRGPLFVLLRQGEVIAYDPAADIIGGLDAQTGKLIWCFELQTGKPLAENRILHSLNTGLSCDGRRLFVYGRRTGMIDLDRRQVEWVIDAEHVAKWPLRLDPPAWAKPLLTTSQSTAGNAPIFSANPSRAFSRSRYTQPQAATGPLYVDYQKRSTTPLTADAARQMPEARIVGPAAVWSTASLSGQPRFAFINGSRLGLCSKEQLSIMDTDLPIAGRTMNLMGNYLGCIGHFACFLQSNQFVGVDLVTGNRRNYSLSSITSGLPNAWVQAVVDGPLVYLAGRQGVLCLNVLSGQRVFTSDWPAGARLGDDDLLSPPAAAAIDQSTQTLWSGMIAPLGGNAHCVPSIAAVVRGRLYVAVTPWRLVAIDGAAVP